jgi:hypothetical protein
MKRILSCLFLIASVNSYAQEKLSYQSPSGIIEFQVSVTEYYVRFKKDDKEAISSGSKTFSEISESSAIIKIEETSSTFTAAQSIIGTKFQGKVLATEPVLVYKDGIRQICNGESLVSHGNLCFAVRIRREGILQGG